MSKTIIERMCSIAEKMRPEDENSGMPIANMKKASADIKALAKTLELTDVQAVILTAIVQKTARYSVSGNDLADELGLEYLKFLTYTGLWLETTIRSRPWHLFPIPITELRRPDISPMDRTLRSIPRNS